MRYLLDTNILIYYLNGDEAAVQFLEKHINYSQVSFINIIEVLSFRYTDTERNLVHNFLAAFHRIDINNPIIDTAIRFRLESKIKLPDCIVAASAVVNDLVLVTRNTKDFVGLPRLYVLDPFLKNSIDTQN